MMEERTGIIFDIKEFAVHDGPGIRTTVFFKGCPLDCTWCHNPEGKSANPQAIHSPVGARIAGRWMTSGELAARLNRQSAFLRENEGGVTFSGGEPLQQAAFAAEVIERLDSIHVLLDTSGFGAEQDFRWLAGLVDLVYFDLKIIDDELHRRYTGRSNRAILRNLGILSRMDTPFVVRIPLVPGVTDTRANLSAAARLTAGLARRPGIELLPYNPLAGAKYASAGAKFNPGFDPDLAVETRLELFAGYGLDVKVRRGAGQEPLT